MSTHDRMLRLAARSLDSPLTAAEQSALDAHLHACGSCARSAREMRRDAAALADLPDWDAPSRLRVRVADAATRSGRDRSRTPAALVFALLLLGSLLAGAALGAAPWDADRATPSPVAVVSTPSASPVPSATADPSPTPGPTGSWRTPTPSDPVPALTWDALGQVAGIPAAARILGLTATADGFVAVGIRAGSAAAWTSQDGRRWLPTEPLPGDGTAGTRVAQWNDRLIAVGYRDDDGRAWLSRAGARWARVGSAGTFSGLGLNRLAVGPAGAVVTTSASVATERPEAVVLHSADGDTWRRVSVRGGVANLGQSNGRFVAVGCMSVESAGCTTAGAWHSSDGLDWAAGDVDDSDFGGMTHLATAADGFVALGGGEPGARTTVWSSSNGGTWARQPEATALRGGRAAILASNEEHVVAVGDITVDGPVMVWLRGTSGAWRRAAWPPSAHAPATVADVAALAGIPGGRFLALARAQGGPWAAWTGTVEDE